MTSPPAATPGGAWDASIQAHRLWRQSGGERGARLVLSEPIDTGQLDGVALIDADLRALDLRDQVLEAARLPAADLRGVDCRGARLAGDLQGVDLRGADLRGALLEGADLRGADLRDADLRGADLFCCLLDEADLRGARLDGPLSPAILEGTMRDLQARAIASGGVAWYLEAVRGGHMGPDPLSGDGNNPTGAFLRALPMGATPQTHPVAARVEAWLTPTPPPTWERLLADHQAWTASRGWEGARMSAPAADLRERDLRGLDLRGCTLLLARLQGADLREARLDDALMMGAGLTGADLRGVGLRRAHLRSANLAGARLSVDASGADLRDVDLDAAIIERLALRHSRLNGLDLRPARAAGMESAWRAALTARPAAARSLLRALQGGVPAGGLLGLLGVGALPSSAVAAARQTALGDLCEGLAPGDMAVTHPVARLLAHWTLGFIRAGGTLQIQRAPEPLAPIELRARLDAHAAWLADPSTGARLSLAGAHAPGQDLSGADLRRADLAGATLEGSIFVGARLEEADCRGADLRASRFGAADLREVRLGGAQLDGSALGGATLRGARLAGTSFARSLLTDVDLQGAELSEASFAGALMTGADLRGGRFEGCDWRGAALAGARIEGAVFSGPWVFGPALQQASLAPIEDALRALTAWPELVAALVAELREPAPRRRLPHLLLTAPVPEALSAIARPWLMTLAGEDQPEITGAVHQTIEWLGADPYALFTADHPHDGHHHH